MGDEFDKKRDVVKQLLGVLKGHAVNEVEGGLKHHEPSMEKVSGEAPSKEHGEMPAAEGGMEEMQADHSDMPTADGAEHKMPEGKMEHEDEESNQSSFHHLMKRKK